VSPRASAIYLDRTSEPIDLARSATANRTPFALDIAGPSLGPCSPVAPECARGIPYLNPLESFDSINSIAFLTQFVGSFNSSLRILFLHHFLGKPWNIPKRRRLSFLLCIWGGWVGVLLSERASGRQDEKKNDSQHSQFSCLHLCRLHQVSQAISLLRCQHRPWILKAIS
jgi:hypothetical protein